MKLFVGITDYEWYKFLSARQGIQEVNFWRPSALATFKALEPGEMFLFKLHSPRNFIVGGGFFIRFLQTPVSLAWRTFTEDNGTNSLLRLREQISRYLKKDIRPGEDPIIGCILLGEVFFLQEDEWIPAPTDFSSNIVQGKGYDLTNPSGRKLWEEVSDRLKTRVPSSTFRGSATEVVVGGLRFGNPVPVTPRLGQGAFRMLVTDVYRRRCAVTRERALPVLEAAHIRPYSVGGEHSLKNGLLLRIDLHRLFDSGYMTIDPDDKKILVSRRLKEEFDNGEEYYPLHGRIPVFPSESLYAPSRENLLYHAEKVFR